MSDTFEDASGQPRPVLNYFEMGFSPGDLVEFEGFPQEVIKVADGRSLLWAGQQVSLTEVRRQLGGRQGVDLFRGLISVAGRDLNAAYDETYGPKADRAVTSHPAMPTPTGLKFSDVVSSPAALMGVKAVWGKSREPVICFGSRGDAKAKDRGHFQQARLTAEKAVHRPFLLTIGGGEQVGPDLKGRVLELVRVSGAYGETSALVHDPILRERLAQWPVAVMLTEVYRVIGDPLLIDDLGFPDRRVLENAYDGVRSNDEDIAALWAALSDWPVELRLDVLPPTDFRDPGKPQLCGTLYPKLNATEGKKRYLLARVAERDPRLSREAKRLNRERNGGLLVCEACDFTDGDGKLFDAHHLLPVAAGERETHAGHLAILCPTCHRWAHAKGASLHEPVPVEGVRAARGPAHLEQVQNALESPSGA